MSKIIWISDLHYGADEAAAGQSPYQRITAAVTYINRHHGDAACCVISGDLVDHGAPEEYAGLRRLLDRMTVPYFPMTGNHDDRAALIAAMPLPAERQNGFVQFAAELPGAVLLCLDTLKTGAVTGELCADRLAWLSSQLHTHAGLPTYVFLHHPPVKLGLPKLDHLRLDDGDALMALLSDHPQVCHVFAGHVHRPCTARSRGLTVTTAKSVLMQSPAPWPAPGQEGAAHPDEAPTIGVLDIDGADMRLQFVEFL